MLSCLAFFIVGAGLLCSVVESKNAHAAWGIPVYTKVDTTNVRAVSAQTSSFIWEGTISYAFADDSFLSYQDKCAEPLPPNTCAPFVGMSYKGKTAGSRVLGPAATNCTLYDGGEGRGHACGKFYATDCCDANGLPNGPVDDGNYFEGYNPIIRLLEAGKVIISSTGVVTIKLASKAVAGQLNNDGWTVATVESCSGTPTSVTCIDVSGGYPTLSKSGTTITLSMNGGTIACKGKAAGEAATCSDINLVLTSPSPNSYWSYAYDSTSGQFWYTDRGVHKPVHRQNHKGCRDGSCCSQL